METEKKNIIEHSLNDMDRNKIDGMTSYDAFKFGIRTGYHLGLEEAKGIVDSYLTPTIKGDIKKKI